MAVPPPRAGHWRFSFSMSITPCYFHKKQLEKKTKSLPQLLNSLCTNRVQSWKLPCATISCKQPPPTAVSKPPKFSQSKPWLDLSWTITSCNTIDHNNFWGWQFYNFSLFLTSFINSHFTHVLISVFAVLLCYSDITKNF